MPTGAKVAILVGSMLDVGALIIILASILVSMTLHEAMHAFVSYWLGDDTAKMQGRLTLNPLAHIDPVMTVLLPMVLWVLGAPPFGAAKPVPFNPYNLRYGEFGAALVGIAGPLTNLALAFLAGGVLQIFGPYLGDGVIMALQLFTLVNAAFFLLNIIPFPPLDGSRVLYAFAPDPVRRVMERIESMGLIAIMVFFFIFYMFLVGIFIQLLQVLLNVITGGQWGI